MARAYARGVLDHVFVRVRDLEVSDAFYAAALAPLGMAELMRFPGEIAYGRDGHPWFWVREGFADDFVHVAFTAPDRSTVDAFHAAALAAGGRDNGAPGRRPHYHRTYYGAFVLDPDGHNVEAVTHVPG